MTKPRRNPKRTDGAEENENLSSMENVSLNEVAYRTLKKAIIFCELAPGSSHTEVQLLDRFQISKAPIRSALIRLSHEGLIDTQARKGYTIAPVTYQDVQDIFSLRLILEPKAARLAAGRLSDELIARILPTLDAQYEPDDHASHIRFLEANRTFYITVAEASGNRRLVSAIAVLVDEMTRLLQLIMLSMLISERARAEHNALFMMLLTGDADASEKLAFEQIRGRQQSFIDTILSNPNRLAMPDVSQGFILTATAPKTN